MIDIDEATFLAAQKRAADRLKKTPVATAAHYDARSDRVIVELSSGLGLMFKPSDVQGLEHATAKDLKNIEITPFGLGLHFPSVDADLYIPGLLDGFLGSKKWMASRMGAAGGKVKSEAKSSASRANGAKGGRPRKVVTDKELEPA